MSSLNVFFAILLCSCTGIPASPNNPSDCVAAEERVRALGCMSSTGDPLWITKKGAHLADVCRSTPADWHPKQLAKISDCTQIDAAMRGEL